MKRKSAIFPRDHFYHASGQNGGTRAAAAPIGGLRGPQSTSRLSTAKINVAAKATRRYRVFARDGTNLFAARRSDTACHRCPASPGRPSSSRRNLGGVVGVRRLIFFLGTPRQALRLRRAPARYADDDYVVSP